jgi:hypothetical protein
MINLKKILAGKTKSYFHSSSADKTPTPTIYAPGTKILYDPGLVDRLKKDHSHLVSVFTDIVSSIERRDYNKLMALNEVFLALFNAHALLEYTKLYVFLDYSCRADNKSHDLVLRFRREMNEIGKNVRGFCHYWRENTIGDASLNDFKDQVQQIGQVLTKRIETEEGQLYEMYKEAPRRFIPPNMISH